MNEKQRINMTDYCVVYVTIYDHLYHPQERNEALNHFLRNPKRGNNSMTEILCHRDRDGHRCTC